MTLQHPGSYDASYTKPPKSLKVLPEARLPSGAPVDFGNGRSSSQKFKPKTKKPQIQKTAQPTPEGQPLAQAQSQTKKTNGKKKASSADNRAQSKPQTKIQLKKNFPKKPTQQLESPLSSPDLNHSKVNSNYTLTTVPASGKKDKPSKEHQSQSTSYAGHSFTNSPDVTAIPKPSFL